MKTLILSNEDATLIQKLDGKEKIAKFLLENAKRSKYGYNGKETCGDYFYVKINDKEFEKISKVLLDTILLSFAFKHQLVSKMKKKEEINEDEESLF